MKLAGWIAAAFLGFALAATFMDAPARWVAELRGAPALGHGAAAGAATAEPARIGRSLAARTRALEEFADRCATEQWEQAEELRDAAGRAELQGDRFSASDFDDQATALYEQARAEASLSREEGRCLDQSTYQEMPQPAPHDSASADGGVDGPLREASPDPGTPRRDPGAPLQDRSADPELLPPRAEPPPADPSVQNEIEAGLRSRASALAARGDPCAAARLLREQGTAQRTLLLAREMSDRCHRRP